MPVPRVEDSNVTLENAGNAGGAISKRDITVVPVPPVIRTD